MSSSTTAPQRGGIGFCGLLALIFITLKLTNYIDWSWWWVLSPMWMPFAFFICFFVIVFLIAGVAAIFASSK